jgi:hypothetical protein
MVFEGRPCRRVEVDGVLGGGLLRFGKSAVLQQIINGSAGRCQSRRSRPCRMSHNDALATGGVSSAATILPARHNPNKAS